MKVHIKKEQKESDAVALGKIGRTKKAYVMDDLDLQDRRPYRKYLLPAYYEFIMSSKDPFDTHAESVIPALTQLFRFLYPHDNRIITADCALKILVGFV